MRVATSYAYESSLAMLQQRQQELSDAQQRLTSGKRVDQPSDDPAAAARIARAVAAGSRIDAQRRALAASKNDMQLSESALGDAGTLLQQARDAVVSAGNGSYTDSDRATLVQQLKGLRSDLLAVANRSDASGRYLFGGQGSDQAPFVDTPAGVTYSGSAGQQQATTGSAMPLSIDGGAAWLQAPDPQHPGSTVSLFDTLDQTIAALGTPGQSSAQIAQAVSQGLSGIDAAAGNLSGWRSFAGAALNRIDALDAQLSQGQVDAQTERSNAEDLDMVQAISDFQNKQTGYSAALQTYSMVQRMSLFDYLK